MKNLIFLSLLLFTRFFLIDGESTSIETYFESKNHPDNYPNNHSEVKSKHHILIWLIMSKNYI